MKIEKAINQQDFRSDWQKATLNLIYTSNWMDNKIKVFFKPYGITTQQFNVLRILRGQYPQPITTSAIRERMVYKMSDVSRIVDRLHKKSLLERKTCLTDKRLVDVIITEKGMQLLNIIDERAEQLDLAKLNLSHDEASQLSELLDKLRGCY